MTMIGTFIDIGFGVIILIAFFVGIGEGFSRQFSKPMCGLIAIFGALGLTALIYGLVSQLGFYGGLEEKAMGLFTAEFYSQQASDPDSLAAILEGGYLRILVSSAEKLWTKMVEMHTTTLGAFFGKLLIKVAAQFIIWLVLYLAIKYLLFGIKYLMTKIARVVVFKSIDRIFGLVWSLVITYIIIVGIILTTGELVTAKFFADIADKASGYIAQTSIVKFLHSTNVIGSFIADILRWPLYTI